VRRVEAKALGLRIAGGGWNIGPFGEPGSPELVDRLHRGGFKDRGFSWEMPEETDLKHMARHTVPGGSLICIASLSGTAAIPSNVLYGCAKAAVLAAVRYAAVEYASRPIRVNAISPGIIDTPMVESLTRNPQVLAGFLKETPLGRITTPEEVADCALWLSVNATSMTGTSTIIDGGMHLRRPPRPEDVTEDAYSQL
jgi:NAD(P)-dependent dehydrogenase (short-subunit alcohol dehydrogenase family)